jgi:antirestriction protein ArdC
VAVNKGEKGQVVVFWKTNEVIEQTEGGEKSKRIPMLRYYKVFNIAQCRDLPENRNEPVMAKVLDPILECEHIVNSMPQSPLITFTGKQAFYDIKKDEVAHT